MSWVPRNGRLPSAGRVQFRTREHRRTHTAHIKPRVALATRQAEKSASRGQLTSQPQRSGGGGRQANQQNGIELKIGGGGPGGWLRSSMQKRLYRGREGGEGAGHHLNSWDQSRTTTDEPGERTNKHELRQWSSPTPVQAPPDSQRQRIDFHEAGWCGWRWQTGKDGIHLI